jgi:hypothetical protein
VLPARPSRNHKLGAVLAVRCSRDVISVLSVAELYSGRTLDLLDIEPHSWGEVYARCALTMIRAELELSELVATIFFRGCVETGVGVVTEKLAVFESKGVAFT